MPIALSDESLSELLRLAAVLPVCDRSEFLQRVADQLSREPTIGDGAVYRAGRQIQSEMLTPPDAWPSGVPRPIGRPRKHAAVA